MASFFNKCDTSALQNHLLTHNEFPWSVDWKGLDSKKILDPDSMIPRIQGSLVNARHATVENLSLAPIFFLTNADAVPPQVGVVTTGKKRKNSQYTLSGNHVSRTGLPVSKSRGVDPLVYPLVSVVSFDWILRWSFRPMRPFATLRPHRLLAEERT